MRGARYMAKLNFVICLVCMQVAGEEELQDLMLFVPIDLVRKVDARRIGIEPKRLQPVYSGNKEPYLFMIEGVKGGKSGMKILTPVKN